MDHKTWHQIQMQEARIKLLETHICDLVEVVNYLMHRRRGRPSAEVYTKVETLIESVGNGADNRH